MIDNVVRISRKLILVNDLGRLTMLVASAPTSLMEYPAT